MTNETKHTPTPWRVEADTTLIWGDCNPDDNSTRGMGYPIAECRINPSGNWSTGPYADEGEANAAHIVKCVNMHDELVEVLSGLMKVYNEPDEEICCNGYHCGCQGASVRQQAEYYAREALKKAGAL